MAPHQRPNFHGRRSAMARRIQRAYRSSRFRRNLKYNRKSRPVHSKKGKNSKTLAGRVRALESASQIKRSYTTINVQNVNDLGLSAWAIDHVPISTALTGDVYGRQANTTKVVGKKMECRLNFWCDSDSPYAVEVKCMLLRSALEDAAGNIIPPLLSDLYDTTNIPAGLQLPPYRMFKPPGATTEVYEKVKVLKQWTFRLSKPTNDLTGTIDNANTVAVQESNTDRTPYPLRKWIYHTCDLNDEVFKFGTGTATVPLGPFRYFIVATSTAQNANHEAVNLDGIIKFSYKDD